MNIPAETITRAASCRNAQDAMDVLEQGSYYAVNHAPDYMVKYLDVCLNNLGQASREQFVRDWLVLVEGRKTMSGRDKE